MLKTQLTPFKPRFSSLEISVPDPAEMGPEEVRLLAFSSERDDVITCDRMPIGRSPVVGELTRELKHQLQGLLAHGAETNQLEIAFHSFVEKNQNLRQKLTTAIEQMQVIPQKTRLPLPRGMNIDQIKQLAIRILASGRKLQEIAWQ